MAKLGRAGHCGSPANASGVRRRLWVVWLLVGCVVLSGGSSVRFSKRHRRVIYRR